MRNTVFCSFYSSRVKRHAILVCSLLGILSLLASDAYAKTCSALQISVSALNVRTGPTTGYSVVGTVNAGERYIVTGSSSGQWQEIWFDANRRWVYAPSAYASPISAECGSVTATALNVRSGPSTGYRIVGTVNQGSSWAVIGTSGSWRQIWYASEARWVYGVYLDQSVPVPEIEITSFGINQGAAQTYSRFTSVSGTYASSNPAYYRISELADFSDTDWKVFSSSINYTVSAGEGSKQVYFQVKNAGGRWSNVISDSIDYIEPTASGYEINRNAFYSNMRAKYGSLNQSQVDGINFLLSNMEEDTRPAIASQTVWTRQIAYLFATVKHEVANTYLPITEYSNTHCVNYDGGCTYKGRGYVQLTHRYNYEKMSSVVGVDLVAYPERALEPDIAYTVMSYGMFYGSFTGARLGDYIQSGKTDYYNARRVVNGTDKASLIAGYAGDFQFIMEQSTVALF